MLLTLGVLTWTVLSMHVVIVIEQPPAADPFGVLRTIALAPGYLAFFAAAALATGGVIRDPWVSTAIVGTTIGVIASLLVVRPWETD